MPKRTQRPTEFEKLIARIDSVDPSYYISRHEDRISDEAILDIDATIERISSRHSQHVGCLLELSFVIERTFDKDTVAGRPHLFSVNLSKKQRSILAYLPADAFWSFPRLIGLGATHIEARFSPTYRGSGNLESVHLASLASILAIGWEVT
ncbi:MAG: hypothetical protein EOO82_00040 [Oxalobacteraceae bacterium]|nr:MAG: hypothetical protein EOO82_00040 [Oxalobacteraceae bacterium]